MNITAPVQSTEQAAVINTICSMVIVVALNCMILFQFSGSDLVWQEGWPRGSGPNWV